MASDATRTLRGWFWPLALGGVIWIASGRSAVAAPSVAGADKVAHFLLFGLLATLVVRAVRGPRRWWAAVLLVSAYGAVDEWHQGFTPGRAVEVLDWVADTAGALVAVAAYACWPAWRTWLERPVFRPRAKSRIEIAPGIPPNRDRA